MKRHFPVIIEQDQDGTFLVECPMFKGCRSYGDNIEEAIKNIKEAIEVCIDEEPILTEPPTFIGIRDLEMAVP
jgi:predicted RNase H-like HicB family nuclease